MRITATAASARWLVLGAMLVACAAAAEDWIYIIQPRDTLIGFSQRYLAKPGDWPRLQRYNAIRDPRRLPPGGELKVPMELLRTRPVTAKLEAFLGEVQVSRGGGAPRPAQQGEQLGAGDVVITGPQSGAVLGFQDGARFKLRENTRASLDRLLEIAGAGAISSAVRLDQGATESTVPQRPAAPSRFSIDTPTIKLGVRGTEFRASVPSARLTRSEVLEGRVVADNPQGSQLVDAGFGTVAEAGAAPLPPRPLLAAPDLSSLPRMVERLPIRLPFAAVPGAKGYRALVAQRGDFDLAVAQGSFASAEAKFADLPDGRYWLRVRAADDLGIEGRDAQREFEVNVRPEPPFTSAPALGGTLRGDEAAFAWAAVQGAVGYHFQLARDPEFRDLVRDEPRLAQVALTLKLEPGSYHWRVATVDPGEEGPQGDPQRFTLKAIPASPAAEPPALDEKNLVFRWAAARPGQSFHFQLARDDGFANLVMEQRLTEPQVVLPRPGPGSYFMRVRTIDDDGFEGPYGRAQRVDIPAPEPDYWPLLMLVPLIFAL